MTDAATEALLGEIHGLLADGQRRFAGRPDLELHALLMVALEREQVVALAYREDAVAGRVASLRVDEGVRRLIHQSLVWIWKDEEVHATYLRGYLLQTDRLLPAALVFARQVYGALSGWATAARELATNGVLVVFYVRSPATVQDVLGAIRAMNRSLETAPDRATRCRPGWSQSHRRPSRGWGLGRPSGGCGGRHRPGWGGFRGWPHRCRCTTARPGSRPPSRAHRR